MAIRPSVSYIPCDTSSKKQTCDIIKFEPFEEGDFLSDTREDAESDDGSSDESKDNSIIP